MSNPDSRERPRGEAAKRAGREHGVVRDEKGQVQPADKQRARQVSRTDRGDDPPGDKD